MAPSSSSDSLTWIDVNEAFEHMYGYSRMELLGHTVLEIGIWDNPGERIQMLDEVRKHGHVRNRVARFRTRSGELLETIYSADIIELDGEESLLAVSEDVLNRDSLDAYLAAKTALAR